MTGGTRAVCDRCAALAAFGIGRAGLPDSTRLVVIRLGNAIALSRRRIVNGNQIITTVLARRTSRINGICVNVTGLA